MSPRYYRSVHVVLDPTCADPLAGGGVLQDVSLILTHREDRTAGPVGIALLACQARELAHELLALADEADRMRWGG